MAMDEVIEPINSFSYTGGSVNSKSGTNGDAVITEAGRCLGGRQSTAPPSTRNWWLTSYLEHAQRRQ